MNTLTPAALTEVRDRAVRRITAVLEHVITMIVTDQGETYGDLRLTREERVLKVIDMLQSGEMFALASVSQQQAARVWRQWEEDRRALEREMQ